MILQELCGGRKNVKGTGTGLSPCWSGDVRMHPTNWRTQNPPNNCPSYILSCHPKSRLGTTKEPKTSLVISVNDQRTETFQEVLKRWPGTGWCGVPHQRAWVDRVGWNGLEHELHFACDGSFGCRTFYRVVMFTGIKWNYIRTRTKNWGVTALLEHTAYVTDTSWYLQ